MQNPSEGWTDANGKRWFRTTRDAVYACHAIKSPTVLAVALRLVEYGADAFPSIDTLARYTRLKERAVRNALRELEQARVITTRRTGRSNHYSLFCNVQIPDLGRFDDAPGPKADEDPPSGVAPASVSPDRHVVPITPETARSARGADQRGARCRSDRHVVPPKQGSKQKSKRVGEARGRARTTAAPLFLDFEGWECSAALRAELIGLGIPSDRIAYRLRMLKNAPINGGKGCRSLDEYVRGMAAEFWVGWEAERRAKANSGAGNAVSRPVGGGGAPPGAHPWIRAVHEAICRSADLDVRNEAERWAAGYHHKVDDLRPVDLVRPFTEYLKQRAKATRAERARAA